jgi:hypothetical protein
LPCAMLKPTGISTEYPPSRCSIFVAEESVAKDMPTNPSNATIARNNIQTEPIHCGFLTRAYSN